jgi:glycosyltransferase 2 family protein
VSASTLVATTARTPPLSPASWAWRIGAAVIGLTLLWRTFHSVDTAQVGRILRPAGFLLFVALLTYLAPIVSDTLGWRYVLAGLDRRPRLLSLLSVRLAVDALQMSLPGGAVLAEAATPALVRSRCHIPLSETAASLAVRKCLFGLTQSGFLVLAVVCGHGLLTDIGHRARWPWPLAVFLSAALVLFCVSAATAWLLGARPMGGALREQLRALPLARLRAFLDTRHAGFAHFDVATTRLFQPAMLLSAAPRFGLIWLLQALDTWFILRLLGGTLGPGTVLSIEAAVSVVRILGVAVPGGLGIQEAGYVAFLSMAGCPSPVALGAAFALTRRVRELLWMSVGYLFLARWRTATFP